MIKSSRKETKLLEALFNVVKARLDGFKSISFKISLFGGLVTRLGDAEQGWEELITPENTITYHIMLFVCHPKFLHKHCLQFLLGVKMAPKETENDDYTKFWGEKQRTLWYVMVFSGVVSRWAW